MDDRLAACLCQSALGVCGRRLNCGGQQQMPQPSQRFNLRPEESQEVFEHGI
jgi:hypothetical protein